MNCVIAEKNHFSALFADDNNEFCEQFRNRMAGDNPGSLELPRTIPRTDLITTRHHCPFPDILLAYRAASESAMPESITLLSSRRFRPFFLTQLLGAFNDNLYKNGLTIFIAFQAVGVTQDESNQLVNIAASCFG